MKNHTSIIIILDRSGSMQTIASDTIGGFNKFLKEQQDAPGSASLTLHQFDNEFETPVKAQDIKLVAPLTNKTFVPRGSTALLDAMGRAITEEGKLLAAMKEQDRPDKVVVVVITDGEENASKIYNRPQVFQMIDHQQKVYKWEFVFLAANQDAIQSGGLFGFKASNSADFGSDTVCDSYAITSSNLTAYRSGSKLDMGYTVDDKKKLKKS